ncbi:putative ribonuclease H-like domain-containing protein, partial [Tanacetum coccineum]
MMERRRETLYQHQEAGKQEKNQMGLLTMDDGIVNWGEHTEAEETNHALMAISSSNEVSLCSKTCIDSYNKLKTLCDEQMNQLGDQEAQILAYSQAVKKLEAQLVTSQKQQLSLNEKLAFQANEIHEKDEKLKRYRRIGMKAVKDKDLCIEGSCGNTSEHSFETESESLSEPNEMSKSRLEVTNEKDVSAPKSKEVEPSCVSHIKTPRQPLTDKETHTVNRKNWNDMMERELGEGYSFTKKKCFVCGSLNHLIKDCDYYEKKMAREAEVKRVVNTGNGVAKPVWTNANRINHANQFVPRSVQLNAGRPKFNTVRPNINTGRTNINSGRPKVNAVSPKVNTVRSNQPVTHKTSNSSSPKRPQMNQMNQRRDFSKSYSSVRRPFANSTTQMANSNAVMGSWGSAVKTSASYNWRNTRPNFNYNSGPTFIRTVNANGPQGRPKPAKAWVTRINWRILKNSMGDLLPLEVAKATYLEEPKKIFEALQDDSWVQAMQEELLQFKLQQVWVLIDLPHGMKVIGTKWVYRNKRDERGVVVRNKARLVAQGYTQEEGIAEIVDFLRGSNLMYALTTNPTIYDSPVKQFWQTVTANTLADGTLELQATIDTIVYTITEASIRNKLQLADASGITMLP